MSGIFLTHHVKTQQYNNRPNNIIIKSLFIQGYSYMQSQMCKINQTFKNIGLHAGPSFGGGGGVRVGRTPIEVTILHQFAAKNKNKSRGLGGKKK